MSRKLKHLLNLLDDENQQTASIAMAELLSCEKHLDSVLKSLQESENPRLRKRIHQMQSVLTLRRRRKNFTKKILSSNLGLLEGLIELHLLWYDNDPPESIWPHWHSLVESASAYNPVSIERIAFFMKKTGFNIASSDDMEGDSFCMGIVLEELAGSDFILCSIAQLLAEHFGFRLHIFLLNGEFALIDERGQMLVPKGGWKLIPQLKRGRVRVWTPSMILRLAGSMLFLSAVSTNSFRYINTVGGALAKMSGQGELSFLPYPYNSEGEI